MVTLQFRLGFRNASSDILSSDVSLVRNFTGIFFWLSYDYKIISKVFSSTLPDAINTTLLPNVTSKISGCISANLNLRRIGDIVN
ncbi:hypothetical protein DN730_08965 [Marinomonas piezotolerans]|uniref:Uncharacterized protein n=1 Tax=Marinomonas piezotolerans TaxID=2213058 RepID=A0A370U9Q9_9GAMM|nr:hypothetical protein DN730_08965 [Marinomonas piezotolerans]